MGSGPTGDLHDHELDVARVHAEAEAVERLERAYAGLERRLESLRAGPAEVEGQAPMAVSPGQPRLVAG